MAKYLSAGDFLAGIQGQAEDYEVAGLGVVKIKSLTTAQARQLYSQYQGDEIGMMLGAVGAGLVEPHLDAEQVAQLAEASVGPISDISKRILQLSGMIDRENRVAPDGTVAPGIDPLAGSGS